MASQRSNLNNITGARVLRAQATHAEVVPWEALRRRKLSGIKFRRQQPIGPFVADFCCTERRPIVEFDGEIHASQLDRDTERSILPQRAGYALLRFSNEEVLQDLAAVLPTIENTARQKPVRAPGYVARREGW
jgi:very-short-patch-repair endonuclease